MALAILNELHDEITRLYIAGSALALGDPRLKKYIPQLQKLAEKAPVFKTLEEKLSTLIQGESKTSPESLMEAGVLLYSLRYTQGTTETGGENRRDMTYSDKKLVTTKASYSRLSGVIEQIDEKSEKKPERFIELFESGQYNDPRLFEKYCQAIGDKKTEISKYVAEVIIPAIGADMIPFIEKDFDIKGGKRHARLFRVLHKLKGKDILPLAEKVLAESEAHIVEEALKAMGDDPKYEETLLLYTKDKKKELKEAAFTALARMGSAKGEEAVLESLTKPKIEHLEEALLLTKNPQILQKIIDEAKALIDSYQKGKTEKGESTKINLLLTILAKRDEEAGIMFLKEALSNKSFYVNAHYIDINSVMARLLDGETKIKNEAVYEISKMNDLVLAYDKIISAARLFSAEEVYNRCRISVTKDTFWQVISALKKAYNMDEYNQEYIPDEKKTWDRRWASTLVKSDGFNLRYHAHDISLFIYDDDEQAWTHLLAAIEQKVASKRELYLYSECHKIFERALANSHPRAKEFYGVLAAAGVPNFDKTAVEQQ